MLGEQKTIHFISIGGSVMHAIAIELAKNGHKVTGSDDVIFSPSKENLERNNILPEKIGYDSNNINSNIDIVVVGMHAKKNNPELLKAQDLNLSILSYPELIAIYSVDKQRIVIAGSHGKSSVVSMLIHILNYHNRIFDYVSGAKPGKDLEPVKLSQESPLIIIEGDEYFTSPLDLTPKFNHYNPHILLTTGINWDHINIFPKFEDYVLVFKNLISQLKKGTNYIYNKRDKYMSDFTNLTLDSVSKFPYSYKNIKYKIREDKTYLYNNKKEVKINVFGKHNIENMAGVMEICMLIGITKEMFFEAISTYNGAYKRLTKLSRLSNNSIFNKNLTFLDFAHSPSKVKATVEAVKEQYPKFILFSFLELHTFSSLDSHFLHQYKDSLKASNANFIYINPKIILKKGGDMISEKELRIAFNNSKLLLITDADELVHQIKDSQKQENSITLIMSSGNTDKLLKDVSYSLPKT